jgi:Rap1a immunity proteins
MNPRLPSSSMGRHNHMSTAQRVSRGFHRLGLLLCALSGVIALASEAAARPVGEGVFDGSANSIYRGCKAFVEGHPTTDAELAILGNYCSGILYALGGVGEYLTNLEWRFCAPENSPASQKARVVVKFLEEYPERMNEDFRRLALEAFHRAWPCN